MKKTPPWIRHLLLLTLIYFSLATDCLAQCPVPSNLHTTHISPSVVSFEWNYVSGGTGHILKGIDIVETTDFSE
jgi:hypothetical protein